MTDKPQVGDWIAFQKAGVVAIGRVLYVQEANSTSHRWTVVTDIGEVWETDILETRRD